MTMEAELIMQIQTALEGLLDILEHCGSQQKQAVMMVDTAWSLGYGTDYGSAHRIFRVFRSGVPRRVEGELANFAAL